MWDRRAEYLENHDGDNATMVLDQGFGDTKLVEIRLLGTFAPELKDPGGTETRNFVETWFKTRISTKTRWNFVVITARMKRVDREQTSLDRWIGTITSLDGTDNLNVDVMAFVLKNGYGHGMGGK